MLENELKKSGKIIQSVPYDKRPTIQSLTRLENEISAKLSENEALKKHFMQKGEIMSLQDSRQISQVKIMLKTGVDGAGIASIEKTGSAGLVDTYTITFDDGRKETFEVTNGEDGNGIASIAKTGTQGLVDTYTITMDDGYTYTFTVTNGRDGGMSTMFVITSDAGSTVTVTTPSGTVIPATQVAGSTTSWQAETVDYGVHTITSTLSGSTQSTTVDVTEAKIYTVHLEHFIATIIATYPSGATCTCVGGGETLTATGSPYTFNVHSADTYTITATDGTHTQTASVTITTDGQSESVTLTFVPEGSTVTPTDDIQTWLHCADIWDKTYTSISQVLADSTTLSALIADSNAVDYMVRSTTWATDVCADSTAMSLIGLDDNCADTLLDDSTWCTAICNSTYFESVLNVKVPTMTSNTTPSGEASASSVSGDRQPWKAFDGVLVAYSENQGWHSGGGSNQWIQYKFADNKKVRIYRIKLYNRTYTNPYSPSQFKVQGSNDNSSFNDITNVITNTNTSIGGSSEYILSNQLTNDDFNIIRLLFPISAYTALAEIVYYCR